VEETTTTPEPSDESLYDVLSASPEYSIYLQLVDAAGLQPFGELDDDGRLELTREADSEAR
jgi:hypothetical protein